MALVTVIPGTFTTPGLPTLGVLGFTDTFERPDADTMGHTEGMPRLPWHVWGTTEAVSRIEGGEARFGRLSAGPCVAVADAKSADVTVEATLGQIDGSQSGVAFRVAAVGDFWSLRQVGSEYRLYVLTANTATLAASSATVTPAPGDVLRVITSGPSIECAVNGTTVISHSATEHADATYCGFYTSAYAENCSFRDIKVTA